VPAWKAPTGDRLLIVLAIATVVQDVSGVVATVRAGGTTPDVVERPIWSADLSIEVPAVLKGGVLLWHRHPIAICAAGLLLQYGLTPLALAWSLALQALPTESALDWSAIAVVLVFGENKSAVFRVELPAGVRHRCADG
jgi:hypothetical protein